MLMRCEDSGNSVHVKRGITLVLVLLSTGFISQVRVTFESIKSDVFAAG